MKPRHTPGPWYPVPALFPDFTRPGKDISGWTIATVPTQEEIQETSGDPTIAGIWGNSSQDRANAILMAAAPDLLVALKNANKLLTQLLPGVKFIVLQDYGFLNDTLIHADATIRKAEGE